MAKVFYSFDYYQLVKYPGFESLFVKLYNENIKTSYAIVENYRSEKISKKRDLDKKEIKIFYEDSQVTLPQLFESLYQIYDILIKNIRQMVQSLTITVE